MTFRYVFLGVSLRSGLGRVGDPLFVEHATIYRPLLRDLARRGHEVTFLAPEQHGGQPEDADPEVASWAKTHVYGSPSELFDRFAPLVRESDLVVVGSHLPHGISVGRWALGLLPNRVAFYDLDPPSTLTTLVDGSCGYLSPELIARYPLYLSCGGGPTLDVLRRSYGAQWVRPLHCSVDPDVYSPEATAVAGDLGYLGPCTADRRAGLDRLLVEPARLWAEGRFIVAGATYPAMVAWPSNVQLEDDVRPSDRPRFYGALRFTLNVSRTGMASAGAAPSSHVFEAAACGTPIISEPWPGLEELFVPGSELLVVRSATEALRLLRELPEAHRVRLGQAARERVLLEHTSRHRAKALERYTRELLESQMRRSRGPLSIGPRGEP